MIQKDVLQYQMCTTMSTYISHGNTMLTCYYPGNPSTLCINHYSNDERVKTHYTVAMNEGIAESRDLQVLISWGREHQEDLFDFNISW